MKKSLSKKILAIFLAVLMLVTAIPFTSFAADDSLDALKKSIKSYSDKMNGTVYTNMQAAYEAYISAKELADAYEYGRVTDTTKLDNAKTKLDTAVTAMKPYTFRTADQLSYTYPKWVNVDGNRPGSETDAVSQAVSRRVLFAGEFSVDGTKASVNTGGNDKIAQTGEDIFDNRAYYGETVLLYDGTVMPKFPVMASSVCTAGVFGDNGAHIDSNRHACIHSIFPSDGEAINYDQNAPVSRPANDARKNQHFKIWMEGGDGVFGVTRTGKDAPEDQKKYWTGFVENNSDYAAVRKTASTYLSAMSNVLEVPGEQSQVNRYNGAWKYFASEVMYFAEDSAFVDAKTANVESTPYTLSEYMGWIFHNNYHGFNGWAAWHVYDWISWGTATSRHSTNVINYANITKLYNSIPNNAKLVNVTSYDQSRDSMIKYMAAIDAITSIATSVDKSETYAAGPADAVNNMGKALKQVNETITSLANLKSDDTSYVELRNAINQYKDIYNGGKGNDFGTYTDDTWRTFERAYGFAEDHMNGLPTNHYANNAAELAANLLTAGKALKKAPGCESDAYVTARGKLKEALKGESLSATALGNVADMLNGKLTFWEVQDWTTVPATKQTELDAETALLNEAIAELAKLADSTTYNLAISMVDTLNADSIDKQVIEDYLDEAAALVDVEVEVLGVKYHGYNYDGAARAIQTVVTENMYWYTIKCIDAEGTTYYLDEEGVFQPSYEEDGADIANVAEFHYNKKVTVQNPTLENQFDPDYFACDWMLSTKAEKTDTESTPKYIGHGETMDIIVRGDTTLYVSSVWDEQNPYTSRIYFVNGSGETVDIGYLYSDEAYSISEQANIPKLAFYEVDSFEIIDLIYGYNSWGNEEIEDVEFDGDTFTYIPEGIDVVVQVNYKPVPQKGVFHVKVVDAAYTTLLDAEYKYNAYVELTNANAKSYKKVVYNEAEASYDTECYLANTSAYSFYVCEDITIMADTAKAPAEISVNVLNKPVTTNGRTYFVGSFACVPEGCEILSAGVVLDRDNKFPTDLSLSKVDKADGVYNMSTTKFVEESNQFVVVATGAAVLTDINYVAYVIYSDGSAVNKIAYSQIKSATVDYGQTL